MSKVTINGREFNLSPGDTLVIIGERVHLSGEIWWDAHLSHGGEIVLDGDPLAVYASGSVKVRGDVKGDARAGTMLDCGDVGGDAVAGTGLTCNNVFGSVKAGTAVTKGVSKGVPREGK
jgi:hypothetical protein